MNFGRVVIHEVSKSMTTLFRSILGGAVGCRIGGVLQDDKKGCCSNVWMIDDIIAELYTMIWYVDIFMRCLF